MASIHGIYAPKKAQARLVPSKHPPNKVLQRQMSAPSKGLKSNVSWQVKSHLIQEPPNHVHQKLPQEIKQVLKDPMQFAKFRYGRVDKVAYWVSHSLSQGVFPRWTPL